MPWRYQPQVDLFDVLVVALALIVADLALRRPKHPVRVTVQAVRVPDEAPIGPVELPADDPMNDDDPHGKAIRALERAEQADVDAIRARAEGVPASELHWAPVSPNVVVAGRVRR